jgi:hypothetical protein
MQSVAGIFRTCAAAEQAMRGLINHGVPQGDIIFLSSECPGGGMDEVENRLDKVPTTDAEADGMGKGIGALMGGGVGAGAGLAGGAAVASMLVPGVGTIFASGLGAAAVLGLSGALAGAKAGDVAEHALDTGIPKDDVMLYRELLKRGRSVIIANVDSDGLAHAAKRVIEENGGEDVGEARREFKAA